MTEELRSKLQTMIDSHDVVLFMKGNREQPQCGFSSRVVGVLEELEAEYQTYNVFSDPDIRSGMKDFSQWPTFPQLYVKQEFLGGCDVITEMMQSGELAPLLGITVEDVPPPTVHCSPSILALFKESLDTHDGGIHLEVSKTFQYDLFVGPKNNAQVESSVDGVPFYFSRGSAKRADGISLDFKDGDNGGVLIDNPNEPKFQDIAVPDLENWLSDHPNAKVYQIGVGTDSVLPFATVLDASAHQEIESLPKDQPIAFICMMGVRSQQAAKSLAFQGYTNILNVVGGLNAWTDFQQSK
jgi:monothiol glutaredoxin